MKQSGVTDNPLMSIHKTPSTASGRKRDIAQKKRLEHRTIAILMRWEVCAMDPFLQ